MYKRQPIDNHTLASFLCSSTVESSKISVSKVIKGSSIWFSVNSSSANLSNSALASSSVSKYVYPSSSSLPSSLTLIAVSYTHLDVYKRQEYAHANILLKVMVQYIHAIFIPMKITILEIYLKTPLMTFIKMKEQLTF